MASRAKDEERGIPRRLNPVSRGPVTVHTMQFPQALPLVLSATLVAAAEPVERAHDLALIIDEPWNPFSCREENDDRFSPWSRDAFAPVDFTSEGEAVPGDERLELTAEAVLDLVREQIAPGTWDGETRSFAVEGTALIVTHEPAVQEEIETLLDALRAEKRAAVMVELAIVPAQALAAVPDPVLFPEAAFDDALARAGGEAEHVNIVGRSRERLRVSSGTRRAVLSGQVVNQTGVVPVVNPTVEEILFGLKGHVQPFLLRGDGGVRLEIDLTHLRPAGPAEKRTTFFSEYDLLPLREERVATTLVLPSGRAGLAGLFSGTGADGKPRELALLARARVRPDPRKPAPAGAEISAWLDLHAARRGRGVALRLEEVEGTLEALRQIQDGSEDGIDLGDGWRRAVDGKAARIPWQASVGGVLGSRMTLRAFDAWPYVGDVDYLSGACFTDHNRAMPVPSVESAGNGLTLTALLKESLEPGLLGLELDMAAGGVAIASTATVLAPAEIGEQSTAPPRWVDPGAEPAKLTPRPWVHLSYQIDLPRHAVLEIDGKFPLRAGRSSLLHFQEAPGGHGRMLIATAALEAVPAPAALGEATPHVFDLSRVARHILEAGDLLIDTGLRAATAEVEEAIRSLIEPETWTGDPNRTDLDANSLTVAGTPEVLAETIGFLTRLETAAARRVRVDLAIVPIDAIDAASPGWDRPGASPWLDGTILDRAAALAGDRVSSIAGAVRLGAWRRFAPRARALHVTDHDVSGAYVTPALHWTLEWKREGLEGDVLLLPSPSGNWFRAEWHIRQERPASAPVKKVLPWGDVELTHDRVQALRGAAPIPRGKALILGVFSPGRGAPAGRGPEPFAALLRARGPTAGRAEADGGDSVRLLDVALLPRPLPAATPPGAWMTLPAAEEEKDDPPRFLAREDEVHRLVTAALGREEGSDVPLISLGPHVAFRATAAEHGAAADRLDEEARRRAPLVQVELWRFTVDAKEAARLRDLDAAGLSHFTTSSSAHARLTAFPGGAALLHALERRAYVGGVHKVTGTRSGSIVEASDPEIKLTEEGARLFARVELDGSQGAILSLRGSIAGAPRFGPTRRVRTEPMLRLDVKGDPSEARVSEGWIDIDLPEVDTDEWNHLGPVPLGRPVVIRTTPAPGEPGRIHVLAALVTVHEVVP